MPNMHTACAQVLKSWGQLAPKSARRATTTHSLTVPPQTTVHKLPILYSLYARSIRRLYTALNQRTTALLSDLCTLSTAPISSKQ